VIRKTAAYNDQQKHISSVTAVAGMMALEYNFWVDPHGGAHFLRS
jgi:hypothetical protein